MSVISDLRTSRELLINLTLREIRGKYKRTALGQAWSLVNPIAQMAIYSLVFGFVLRSNPGPGQPSGLDVFALWLSCALLPWLFFANVVSGGMGALVSNSNLIKKVYFPRETLVISNTMSWLYTFVIEMAVLTTAIVIFGGAPWAYLPLLAVAMVVLALFGLGIALLLSVANVYFRDTQHFVAILLQLWFYATPIIYPGALVQGKTASHGWIFFLYRLNPMERFAEVFRNLLYDNRLPHVGDAVAVTVAAAASLLIGSWVFRSHVGRLAEEL